SRPQASTRRWIRSEHRRQTDRQDRSGPVQRQLRAHRHPTQVGDHVLLGGQRRWADPRDQAPGAIPGSPAFRGQRSPHADHGRVRGGLRAPGLLPRFMPRSRLPDDNRHRHEAWFQRRERPRMLDQIDADRFVNEFPQISRGRRVIIYAGAEAARCPGITELTTALSETLQAPTVWSVNGANAISSDNPYGYGYISF